VSLCAPVQDMTGPPEARNKIGDGSRCHPDTADWALGVGSSACPDDKGAAGGLDDVAGDGVEFVDLHDAFDLGEESVDEPEVASGDTGDGPDGLGVGEVVGVEGEAESAPVAFEDEGEFVVAKGAVVVGEADSAVELRVPAEPLLDPGHADQDEPDVVAVVAVSDQFERGGGEAFGLVDITSSTCWYGRDRAGFVLGVGWRCWSMQASTRPATVLRSSLSWRGVMSTLGV
jgi:hypothetical protein